MSKVCKRHCEIGSNSSRERGSKEEAGWMERMGTKTPLVKWNESQAQISIPYCLLVGETEKCNGPTVQKIENIQIEMVKWWEGKEVKDVKEKNKGANRRKWKQNF